MIKNIRKIQFGWLLKTIGNVYFFSHLIAGLAAQKTKPEESDLELLQRYNLITRQLPPPNITLLRHEVLVLNFFDYTTYPPLLDGITAHFDFRSFNKAPFYKIYSNKKMPNLSYLLINASQVNRTDPISFEYHVYGFFQKGTSMRSNGKHYKMWIRVIDSFKPSKANFENYEEGFTMKMRSNDTNVTFPMNVDDFFGDNLNLTFKLINSSLGNENAKIDVKIQPKLVTFNTSNYRRLDRVQVDKAIGLSLSSDAEFVQRTDKRSLYRFDFVNYTNQGVTNLIEGLTLNSAELRSDLKINAYTHMVSLNSGEKASYMALMLLRMNPKDPLPLSRLFYSDFKMVYYQTGPPMYAASQAWLNNKIFWVFKLAKWSPIQIPGVGGFVWEQIIEIFGIYLPDQSMRRIDRFNLRSLKSQLDGKLSASRNFKNITCEKIEIFARVRGVLGCKLFDQDPSKEPSSIEIHIVIEIKEYQPGKFSFVIEDVVDEVRKDGKNLVAKCLVNFYPSTDSRTNQKYIIKPFVLIYYVPGQGYFMRSSNEEWLGLYNDVKLIEHMKLTDLICEPYSKTLVLRYQRELKNITNSTKYQGF